MNSYCEDLWFCLILFCFHILGSSIVQQLALNQPTSLLIVFVTLSTSLNLFEPPFPHLKRDGVIVVLFQGFLRLSEMMDFPSALAHYKPLRQCSLLLLKVTILKKSVMFSGLFLLPLPCWRMIVFVTSTQTAPELFFFKLRRLQKFKNKKLMHLQFLLS